MTAIFSYIVGGIVFVGAFLVLTQNAQLFPGAVISLFHRKRRDPRSLPPNVESTFISTRDGKRIEVWRLPAESEVAPRPYIGLVFHGNAGTVENFFLMQLWFSALGITSYAFDYRGFGKSSGWPTERGINEDSDAFWNYVTEREQVSSDKILICGFSVGGAPAARIASLHQPKVLILVSAFMNLKQVLRDQLLLRFLSPLLWYKMPTIEYVRSLQRTNLILAHSERDTIIAPYHSVELEKAYGGKGVVRRITDKESGHNLVFYAVRKELAAAVENLL